MLLTTVAWWVEFPTVQFLHAVWVKGTQILISPTFWNMETHNFSGFLIAIRIYVYEWWLSRFTHPGTWMIRDLRAGSNGVSSVPGRTALARFRQAQLEEGKVKVGLNLPHEFLNYWEEVQYDSLLTRLQTPDLPLSRPRFPVSYESVHLNPR